MLFDKDRKMKLLERIFMPGDLQKVIANAKLASIMAADKRQRVEDLEEGAHMEEGAAAVDDAAVEEVAAVVDDDVTHPDGPPKLDLTHCRNGHEDREMMALDLP